MINKKLVKIIEKESTDIIRNLLLDLIIYDKKNEERILELILKY